VYSTAALNDGPVEQALGARHRHERGDFSSPTRLTKDRDEVGVAAKAIDVVAHPLERCDDVEQPDRAGAGEIRAQDLAEIREAKNVQPVVDAHDHHVTGARQL
jgi:hypothetical protein